MAWRGCNEETQRILPNQYPCPALPCPASVHRATLLATSASSPFFDPDCRATSLHHGQTVDGQEMVSSSRSDQDRQALSVRAGQRGQAPRLQLSNPTGGCPVPSYTPHHSASHCQRPRLLLARLVYCACASVGEVAWPLDPRIRPMYHSIRGLCRTPPLLSGTWPWSSIMHVLVDFLSVITLVNSPPTLFRAWSDTETPSSQHVLAAACLSSLIAAVWGLCLYLGQAPAAVVAIA